MQFLFIIDDITDNMSGVICRSRNWRYIESAIFIYYKGNIAIPVETVLTHTWVHQITLSAKMTHLKYDRFWADRISLISPLLIEISEPNQKSKRSFMCSLRLSNFPQSIGIFRTVSPLCVYARSSQAKVGTIFWVLLISNFK